MTYKFKNPFYTQASDIEEGDAFGVKIVAIVGYANDWAAYIGPIDWSDEMVADQGDKLSPEHARPLFHALRESGRSYRL